MVFSSLIFLFAFLPIFLVVYFIVPKGLRNLILLIASLIFYAWGEPIYIFLMLFSIMVDYFHGLLVERYADQPKKAKLVVLSSITLNLALLILFKYSAFIVENVNYLLNTNFLVPEIKLPIGISFYTFQTMSYTIDIYRKEATAKRSMIDLGAYVTMFPQLIAGPIVRYQTIAHQLSHRIVTESLFASGVRRFIIGLGKKVLLANNIGLLWNQISSKDPKELPILLAWLGLVAFGFQIYFDFSGYSDMAIGLGRMLGFEFLENFNYPYIAQSITEFWRRWHISLGTWFRDYVYIPLGGNRKGKLRQYFNILIVWMLTGLWHGASWNFIWWGLYFAFFIILEKIIVLKWLIHMPRLFRHTYTLFILLIGWGLFACENLSYLKSYFSALFGLNQVGWCNQEILYIVASYGILLIILIFLSMPVISTINQWIMKFHGASLIKVIVEPLIYLGILTLSTAYLVDSSYNPFLYFRF